ncbi:MAG TPA: FtsX-like permease family protein [Bacteroidetes bacterium]|nr:FtsX-like permease family protein [Bacteroidota bacterium]
MNLPLKIARRYLFAKKSTNAINFITGISVLGISIGTAALVLVLSVFNGFEDLLLGMFSKFNPDVKVTVAEGKSFVPDPEKLAAVRALPGVAAVSESLQEVAFFAYRDNEDFGILKGVDSIYQKVTGMDTTLFEGKYLLRKNGRDFAVLGGGMRNKLQVDIEDPFEVLNVFMAKRKKVSGLQSPFKKRFAYPAGSFKIQQDFDSQYIIVSLEFARELLGAYGEVSALEIRLAQGADKDAVIGQVQNILGPGFHVKDRYGQEASFLKVMNIEKWMFFAMFSLILVLVAFNMIGTLWMIVLEKKRDISILKSMGATAQTIRNVFLNEGLLLCALGLLFGFAVAIVLYVLQKMFGLVSLSDGFVVDAYPISMRFFDLLVVIAIVVGIGFVASFPAALRAMKVPALMRDE